MGLTKLADIKFTVKFEDGKQISMTAQQIDKLKDRRRYEVLDSRGKVIMKKSYRG